LALAIAASALDYQNILSHILGALAVFLPTALIFYLSGGRGIGGGDVKLMAVCGLFLGWKLIILGFFIACFLGALIHSLRMKLFSKGRVLAMGPYLSVGVFIALLWGEGLINWYIGLLA
ncbi:MAG: prepilin peptidase, partial [Clostridiales bacterium]|nr:prepilin peptidase [Clostridiales bacterium]